MADFATALQLRNYMRTDSSALDDTTASIAIAAATSAIRRYTNRQFETQDAAATTRYFTPLRPPFLWKPFVEPMSWNWYTWNWYAMYVAEPVPDWKVPIDDLFLVNQVLTDLTFTDFSTGNTVDLDRLWPYNAAAFDNKPYTAAFFTPSQTLNGGEGSIVATAKWGWPSLPDTILNACLLQAARYVKRRDSPLGVAGVAEMTGAVMMVRRTLDPDVEQMVADFRRPWAAA